MNVNNMTIRLLSTLGEAASVFGVSLMDAIKRHPEIMVLSADMSNYAGLGKFKKTYPDRFINMGIQEQNMIGTAAGLCSEGWKVIVEAQSCFLSMRAYEQIRQYSGYMKFPIIYVGINGGLSLTYMGNTHFSMEDSGLMKNIPGMVVFSPCDALEAVKCFETALTLDAPAYIRLMGSLGSPSVHSEDFTFTMGKVLKLEDGDTVQILATGNMVGQARTASKILRESGISVSLYDVHTLKPFDADCINHEADLIVTIEEHTIISGLGASVSACLSERKMTPRLLRIGIDDEYVPVGEYQYMLENSHLDGYSVAKEIIKTLKNGD